jgi:casein kinase 1
MVEVLLYIIIVGIQKIQEIWSDDEYIYMATSQLGKNLDALLANCGEKFSLKTVLMLADQIVKIINQRLRELNMYILK